MLNTRASYIFCRVHCTALHCTLQRGSSWGTLLLGPKVRPRPLGALPGPWRTLLGHWMALLGPWYRRYRRYRRYRPSLGLVSCVDSCGNFRTARHGHSFTLLGNLKKSLNLLLPAVSRQNPGHANSAKKNRIIKAKSAVLGPGRKILRPTARPAPYSSDAATLS